MKKIILIPFYLLFLILFSCLNKGNKAKDSSSNADSAAQSPAKMIGSDCIYKIDSADSRNMIDNFNELYSINQLGKEYWIAKEIFMALNDSISNNSNYDGFRVYFGGKGPTKLIIVPTYPVNSSSEYEQHTNIWGEKINYNAGCNADNICTNLNENDAKDLIDDFGETFRREQIRGDRNSALQKGLSSGIWVNKCVLEVIVEELNNSEENLDGMMAISAAYLGFSPDSVYIGQDHENQSTLIFAPTTEVSNEHIINWRNGGKNHSQLCPRICD